MDDDRNDRAVVVAVGAGLPIAVGALLVLVRDEVVNANHALVLMGVVVLVATGGGSRAGALAGVTAALSFDFFLTKPYLTLRITSDDDIVTTVILFLVGVAVGQLADRAQKGRQANRDTRSELTGLLQLRSCSFETGPPATSFPGWSAAACWTTPPPATRSCGGTSKAGSNCPRTASSCPSSIAARRSAGTS